MIATTETIRISIHIKPPPRKITPPKRPPNIQPKSLTTSHSKGITKTSSKRTINAPATNLIISPIIIYTTRNQFSCKVKANLSHKQAQVSKISTFFSIVRFICKQLGFFESVPRHRYDHGVATNLFQDPGGHPQSCHFHHSENPSGNSSHGNPKNHFPGKHFQP